MNYEEMSDFEINLAAMRVVKDWQGGVISNQETSASGFTTPLVIQGATMGNTTHWFDPCNSPSDAWPIILSNNIDIFFNVQSKDGAYSAANSIDVTDNNPLRAAMIVFLKMQEELS